MGFLACILKPRGPLHLGEREKMREGSTPFVHSDTLFSALCHCLLLLAGRKALEEFLAAEQGTVPPLRTSSAFPRWQGQFYLPVPRNVLPQDKETKRLKFVTKSAFERLIAGETVPDLSGQGIPREDARPWSVEDVPKVRLSRLSGSTSEGALYHVGQVIYEPDAELYFLMKPLPAEWKARVEAAVRLMCDEGIGGYRSAGKGNFEQPRFEDFVLATPESAQGWLSLSLYYPADAELTGLGDGCYDLLTRSGYVYSPDNRSLRRKTVRMFSEGSVFPGSSCQGRLADVTPDGFGSHDVWRNGLALAVPCRLAQAGKEA
jgi:CRISPR-associated protein Csm4